MRVMVAAAALVLVTAACSTGSDPSAATTSTTSSAPPVTTTTAVPAATSAGTAAAPTVEPPTFADVFATHIPLTIDASSRSAVEPPLFVYRPTGGWGGSAYVLMVWPDATYREYGTGGLDLESIEMITALADVRPGRSGRLVPSQVEALEDSIEAELDALEAVEDDTMCVQTDGVARGYGFVLSGRLVSFSTCHRPNLATVAAADAIIGEVEQSAVKQLLPASAVEVAPTNLWRVMGAQGHVVEGTITAVNLDAPSIEVEIGRRLAGMTERVPEGRVVLSFPTRRAKPAEIAAIEAADLGDPAWLLIDREGEVISGALFDEALRIVDTGPAKGGLSLGNDAALFAALFRQDQHVSFCDPMVVAELEQRYTEAGALLVALNDRIYRTAYSRDWLTWIVGEFTIVEVVVRGAEADQWLVATSEDLSSVRIMADTLRSGADESGAAFAGMAKPPGDAVMLWEVDRAVLEAANCSPVVVWANPALLADYGTLLATVEPEDTGGPSVVVRIDLRQRDNGPTDE